MFIKVLKPIGREVKSSFLKTTKISGKGKEGKKVETRQRTRRLAERVCSKDVLFPLSGECFFAF